MKFLSLKPIFLLVLVLMVKLGFFFELLIVE
jgi:hypothetical protein